MEWNFCVDFFFHNAVFFELLESERECFGAYADQCALELAESFGAFAELTKNKDSPFTADNFDRPHDAVFISICHESDYIMLFVLLLY